VHEGVGVGISIVGIVVGSTVEMIVGAGVICGGSVGGTKKVGVEDGAQEFKNNEKANIKPSRFGLETNWNFITPVILWRRNNIRLHE
jgi:hypothetical protein